MTRKKKVDDKKKDEDDKAVEDKKRDEEKRAKDTEEKKLRACKNVVPGSAKRLDPPKSKNEKDSSSDDDEFVLYRVVVMRKGLDTYRNICRERRYTARPFKYDPDDDKSQLAQKKTMVEQREAQFRGLVDWCQTTFSDAFAAWMHIKAMRLFVEAVLRYGLPIDFTAILIKPKRGVEKKLREMLAELYRPLAADSSVVEQLEQGEQDLSGLGADFYPYVYLPVNLSEAANN